MDEKKPLILYILVSLGELDNCTLQLSAFQCPSEDPCGIAFCLDFDSIKIPRWLRGFRPGGAMVAQLTPDQKVEGSSPFRVKAFGSVESDYVPPVGTNC